MEFTFTKLFIMIITLVISIIAVRFTFSFDFNKYLERRDRKMRLKIKNNCPHAFFEEIEDGKFRIKSSFVSPPGRLDFICQKCRLNCQYVEANSEKKRLDYFLKNPRDLERQEKEFIKLAKKAGLT